MGMIYAFVAVVRKPDREYHVIKSRDAASQRTAITEARDERREEIVRFGHVIDSSSAISVETLVEAANRNVEDIDESRLARVIRPNPHQV